VLEEAAGDTAVALHPAAVGQAAIRLLDAAQRELEELPASVCRRKRCELVSDMLFLTGHENLPWQSIEPLAASTRIARSGGTAGRSSYAERVDIVATADAVDFVADRGGRLYVWKLPGRT